MSFQAVSGSFGEYPEFRFADEFHRSWSLQCKTQENNVFFRTGGYRCIIVSTSMTDNMGVGTLRILIVTFSATGNTSIVSEMLGQELVTCGHQVQRVELDHNGIFHNGTIAIGQYLTEKARPHDCIMVGGPVYAGHIQKNVKTILLSLPSADAVAWGRIAVPFITWGGISSGIALREVALLLKQSGRTPVLAMKIAGRHSLSRKYDVVLHEGRPGSEAQPSVRELAERLSGIDMQQPVDISHSLDYQGFRTKYVDTAMFNEKGLKLLLHPGMIVDYGKCTGCGQCIKACPVRRLEMRSAQPHGQMGGAQCIYCTECHNACPSGAIKSPASRLEWLITNGGAGKGPLACRESPLNVVYPIG